jgi:O-antigen ligase
MPVGTQARTGLICIGVLVVLILRDVKRRLLYLGLIAAVGLATIPFLPESFTGRMQTIQTYQADSSAATRLVVWAWTWDYVKDHPLGGGFEAYRQNRITVQTTSTGADGGVGTTRVAEDAGRAYHSSYFEMLGEQGFPGIAMFLLLHFGGLIRMEVLRRRYRRTTDETEAWVAPLATALQHAQIIYLVGSFFVGIAWQPFIYMLIAVQIGLDLYLKQRERTSRTHAFVRPKPAAATEIARA